MIVSIREETEGMDLIEKVTVMEIIETITTAEETEDTRHNPGQIKE